MSELLVLAHEDVKRLLPMDECIELMTEALSDLARGRSWQPLRFVVRPPEEQSLMGLMPAHRSPPGPGYGLKAVCIFPGNPARGLDAHQGGVLLFDGETGQLRALIDGSAVTSIRTAAVTAVATRALARPDSRVLAIVGSGVQARPHLEAMAKVLPFEQARVWSRTPEHAQAFAAEAEMPFPVEAAENAEAAVRGADVVVTVTSAREPVVDRSWLAPGAHVNAVGSSIPTARELDSATIAAEEEGIGPDHIRAELGELLIGSHQGRRSDEELTVFISLGLAVEDLAVADYLHRRARTEGAGAVVQF